MIPGAYLVYGCPKCGRKVMNRSLISGNTCGATLFSDGTRVAPMLPEYPREAKCKGCGTFFDFSKENFIKTVDFFNPIKGNYDHAVFLTMEEYQEKISLNIGDETENRLKVWRISNKKVEVVDTEIYKQNCERLIELLQKSKDTNAKITLAELYRNIGEFPKCTAIINALNKDYDWLKKSFLEQCAAKNTRTFAFKK